MSEPKLELFELASGLKYRIYQHGIDESSPQPGQLVTMHYTGWLEEAGERGRQFDSSFEREQPFSFIVGAGQVIAGWDEGILSMHLGEERELIIPPQLAYGEHGYPGVIPPNATLIFRVKLLSFK